MVVVVVWKWFRQVHSSGAATERERQAERKIMRESAIKINARGMHADDDKQ